MRITRVKLYNIVLIIFTLVFLTGCNTEKFNAYAHMRDTLMCNSSSSFDTMSNYFLGHVKDDLKEQYYSDFYGVNIDPNYSLEEKNVWVENNGNQTIILAEYLVETTYDMTQLIAYFTYEGDMLIDYKLRQVVIY